jgi:ADP-heptose:LPS heptosyltransferase
MKYIYFPQPMKLNYDDNTSKVLPAHPPMLTNKDGNIKLVYNNIFLINPDPLDEIHRLCVSNNIKKPGELSTEFIKTINNFPIPVNTIWEQTIFPEKSSFKVALINGAGGGVGDGIMFAPALEILIDKLHSLTGCNITLEILTHAPALTVSALKRIRGIKIRRTPLSLADFLKYDAYLDFSGMMKDPIQETSHITDYVLSKIGINPEKISAQAKEPLLRYPPKSLTEIDLPIIRCRQQSKGKKLIALIVSSTKTRTMPPDLVAELIRILAPKYQPVLMMLNTTEATSFIKDYELTNLVLDLSPVASPTDKFIRILEKMDAIVTIDTSAVHIGGALRIPTIGIFNSINKDYRIKYSPSVLGIQLEYQGKKCKAPCGICKSSLYFKASVSSGQNIHWNIIHACDESIDKETILENTLNELNALQESGNFTPRRLNELRNKVAREMNKNFTPCWQSLQLDTIPDLIEKIIKKTKTLTPEHPCPVCQTQDSHYRLDRVNGHIRYFCKTCSADFFKIDSTPLGQNNTRTEMPQVYQEEKEYLSCFSDNFPHSEIFWVNSGYAQWDNEWQENFQDFQSSAWYYIENKNRPFSLIIIIGALELTPEPFELINSLAPMADKDTLWFLGTTNKNNIASQKHETKQVPYFPGPGWQMKTHIKFIKKLGLNLISHTHSPLTEQLLKQQLGPVPSLKIQLYEGEDDKTKGKLCEAPPQEITRFFYNYLSPALKEITGQGRFCFSISQGLPSFQAS